MEGEWYGVWRALPRIAAGVVGTVLAVGCLGWRGGRVELSPAQVRALPGAWDGTEPPGVSVRRSPEGVLELGGVFGMDEERSACAARIPLESAWERVPLMRVRVSGTEALALVDTGASVSLATFDAARAGGVRLAGNEPMWFASMTFGGSRDAAVGVLPDLQIGDLRVENLPVGVVNRLPGVPAAGVAAAEAGVLLGQDLMRRFAQVRFDGPLGEICWLGREAPPAADPAPVRAAAPFVLGKDGLPRFTVRVGDGEAVDAVWDSGGAFGLWIPWSMAGRLDLPRPMDPVEARVAAWFRASTSRLIHPCAARIGRLTIPRLTTYVGMIRGGDHDPDFVLLGSEVLERHAITLDYERGEVRFYDTPAGINSSSTPPGTASAGLPPR